MNLRHLLQDYEPLDATEAAATRRLVQFLGNIGGNSPFERELAGTAPECGHITGSAWIINENATCVVMLHHAKLNLWVQPGGHCDGESDVLAVAMREAREETGLEVEPVSTKIFDIDVHLIPEYWNTPEHWHFDVRFLLCANGESTPVSSHESRAVRWVCLEEAASLNGDASITRMIAKTRCL